MVVKSLEETLKEVEELKGMLTLPEEMQEEVVGETQQKDVIFKLLDDVLIKLNEVVNLLSQLKEELK